ncbi:hypothetical protein DACRYDRAFT_115706 [Dacryopinax primogenitus]|uniref:Uncharacterized protein n=1 Tax=Dacryopinax primogenitus (strain DJM 731) TaxID=1858805 RepID=M5G396_DACPD|nr:uncharacterized protein DACRYDRAFT_115706 [Dacryopinax primogenitus]EJU02685.1 hypothetical protein DACRYDRAFT_115706 [Dacryopinax primogenitus]
MYLIRQGNHAIVQAAFQQAAHEALDQLTGPTTTIPHLLGQLIPAFADCFITAIQTSESPFLLPPTLFNRIAAALPGKTPHPLPTSPSLLLASCPTDGASALVPAVSFPPPLAQVDHTSQPNASPSLSPHIPRNVPLSATPPHPTSVRGTAIPSESEVRDFSFHYTPDLTASDSTKTMPSSLPPSGGPLTTTPPGTPPLLHDVQPTPWLSQFRTKAYYNEELKSLHSRTIVLWGTGTYPKELAAEFPPNPFLSPGASNDIHPMSRFPPTSQSRMLIPASSPSSSLEITAGSVVDPVCLVTSEYNSVLSQCAQVPSTPLEEQTPGPPSSSSSMQSPPVPTAAPLIVSPPHDLPLLPSSTTDRFPAAPCSPSTRAPPKIPSGDPTPLPQESLAIHTSQRFLRLSSPRPVHGLPPSTPPRPVTRAIMAAAHSSPNTDSNHSPAPKRASSRVSGKLCPPTPSKASRTKPANNPGKSSKSKHSKSKHSKSKPGKSKPSKSKPDNDNKSTHSVKDPSSISTSDPTELPPIASPPVQSPSQYLVAQDSATTSDCSPSLHAPHVRSRSGSNPIHLVPAKHCALNEPLTSLAAGGDQSGSQPSKRQKIGPTGSFVFSLDLDSNHAVFVEQFYDHMQSYWFDEPLPPSIGNIDDERLAFVDWVHSQSGFDTPADTNMAISTLSEAYSAYRKSVL